MWLQVASALAINAIVALLASPISAQEPSMHIESSAATTGMVSALRESGFSGLIEWKTYGENVPASEFADVLEKAGWDDEAIKVLDVTQPYNVYVNSAAPGAVSYLGLKAGDASADPVVFQNTSMGLPMIMSNKLDNIDSDTIRTEIIAGINSTIDQICGMRGMPYEIKAKGSAVGILEMEVTWRGVDVCPQP